MEGYEKNRDFLPIYRFISEMIQDTVYYECEKENVSKFSDDTIFSDHEGPLTHIWRSCHYLTRNISEMVRDTNIVIMDLHMPH